jgi:hypothetical protein
MLRSTNVDTPRSQIPERTTITEIALGELEAPEVCAVLAIWNVQRGAKLMPTREEIFPRALGRLARNVSLIKVLTETDDYEFRIIGDAHVQAYGQNPQGMLVSEVIGNIPKYGQLLKGSYDLLCAKRAPVGFRGVIGRDVTRARFDWLETLYMPLGTAEGCVEYIMNAAVYTPRGGAWQH